MCGVAGCLERSGRREEDLRKIASAMAGTLRHRGPDDSGTWVDAHAGIAFGHRRLAVLDRSASGAQPMTSASGRFVIVFNGEIYNWEALRRELEPLGHQFRGRSDTEVMLAAISQWGVTNALTRFNGMFAFALWDCLDRALLLARDRMGEKPMYYAWMGHAFLFGSELKALRGHPDFQGEIDRDVLALYFRHNYVPTPYSIYRSVYKLPPGCVLRIPCGFAAERPSFSPFPDTENTCAPVSYWSLTQTVVEGSKHPFDGSAVEATAHLESLLADAVSLRMVADVPVGAFLSGGIDSSTVVAMMQTLSNRPVRTFCIGSDDPEYDEASDARAVAAHLGTTHLDRYASADDATRIIPRLPSLYDEPFADSSQIPTAIVAELARQDVTVCLSGDGGDELFAGYNLYFWATRVWKLTRHMPSGVRNQAAQALTMVAPHVWDTAFKGLNPLLPSSMRQTEAGDKLHRLADLLPARSPIELYTTLMSRWRAPTALVVDASEPQAIACTQVPELSTFIQQMMYCDLKTYLPDDLLVKVDRATMGVGLEVRIPLLDHRIVEFAARLPLSMMVKGSSSKWLMRQLLHRRVPPALVERRKAGFSVPISSWLRGPLREWAEALLSPTRLQADGYLNPTLISRRWSEHLSGGRNWSRELWEVLMFQAWLHTCKGSDAVA